MEIAQCTPHLAPKAPFSSKQIVLKMSFVLKVALGMNVNDHTYFSMDIPRGVRGVVRLGYEAKSEPIQKIKHVRFGSVRLVLKKSEPI